MIDHKIAKWKGIKSSYIIFFFFFFFSHFSIFVQSEQNLKSINWFISISNQYWRIWPFISVSVAEWNTILFLRLFLCFYRTKVYHIYFYVQFLSFDYYGNIMLLKKNGGIIKDRNWIRNFNTFWIRMESSVFVLFDWMRQNHNIYE